MYINFNKNYDLIFLSILLTLKKLLLIYFYFFEYIKIHSLKNRILDTPYIQALNENFFEYFIFFHTKPIGVIIRDKISLLLFNDIIFGNFLILSLLNIITVLLVYKIFRLIGLKKAISIFVCVLVSCNFSYWEYWRFPLGGHFDHLNPFLFTLFSYSLFCYLSNKTFGNSILIGIASSTLIMFHSVSFYIIPCILFFLFMCEDKTKKTVPIIMVYLIIPTLVILSLGIKNLNSANVFASSSLGGINGLQYISTMNSDPMRVFTKDIETPKWWSFCYNNSTLIENAPNVGKIFGMCFKGISDFEKIKDSNKICDFKLLKTFLINNDNTNLLNKLLKDEKECSEKPWKYSGGVLESNFRISSEYGKIGQNLWIKTLLEYPLEFIDKFDLTTELFFKGPFWFTSKLYEPQLRVYPDIFNIPSIILGWILKIGSYLSLLIPILLLLRIIKSFLRLKNPVIEINLFFSKYLENCKESLNIPILLISLMFLINTILTNIVTCCENQRMFVSIWILPLIVFFFITMNFKYYLLKQKLNLLNIFVRRK